LGIISEGPQGLAQGLRKGTAALMTGVTSGIVEYTASVVSSATSGVNLLGQGAVSLAGDKEDRYMQNREVQRQTFKGSAGGVLSGLKKGGADIFSGFKSGITGLVVKPIQQGKKSGAIGIMQGVGMGLVGAVVKPVLGVSDGIASVAAGFTKQFVDPATLGRHMRPTRAFEQANPLDGKVLVLAQLDTFAAKAQDFLRRTNAAAQARASSALVYDALAPAEEDSYLASCPLGYSFNEASDPLAECGLLLSTKHIRLLSVSVQKLWEITFSELSHIVLKDTTTINKEVTDPNAQGVIGFVLYGCSLPVTKYINCPTRMHAIRMYAFLMRFSHYMGNAAAIVPLEAILAESAAASLAASRADSAASYKSFKPAYALENYVFGFANNLKLPMNISMSLTSEFDLIDSFRHKFQYIFCKDTSDAEMVYFYQRQMDETIWALVNHWKYNHHAKLKPCHCCACLVINSAPAFAPLQLIELDLLEGRDFAIIDIGGAFDSVSRCVAPSGGAVLLFVYGHPPSLQESSAVRLRLRTSAFTAHISSDVGEPNSTSHNGFTSGYLEKAHGDYWSKAVINVSLKS
jgi:hypothetical protein